MYPMTKTKPFLGAFILFAMMASGFSQTLSQTAIQRMNDHSFGATSSNSQRATLPRIPPQALRPANFLKDSFSAKGSSVKGDPGGLPGVDSVPNFTRAFYSQGQTWPFTMIGNDPLLGRRTRVPVRILAVSL